MALLRSGDSMEHLSPEERACLMYLEETIEALEVQEDSGVSNDESDSGLQADKPGQPKVDDISGFKLDEFGRAEPHPLNQTSEPQSFPVSAANTKDLISTSQSVMTQPKPPDTESHPPSAPQSQVLCVSTDGDGKPKIVRSSELCPIESTEASEIDLGLIPPPSDFMDGPLPHAQTKTVLDHPPPAGISQYKQGAPIDLDMIRQRASMKRTPVSPQEALKTPPPEVSPTLSPPPINSDHQLSPSAEAAEPKSPPAVAPKPKKLPPNIILKSHKASVASSEGNMQQSVPTSSDRVLLDPQRVRMEALRKLGLLKSNEADSGPALSPNLSPKTRRSWGAPHSPISSPAPQTPPLTPSSIFVDSPPPTFVPPQPSVVSSSAISTAPDILPAPAAFSDPVEPLPSDNEPFTLQDASEAIVKAQMNTPPLTSPAHTKKLTPPKIIGVKSATLERSGLGLSRFIASQVSSDADNGVDNKLSPSQLRNNRPRPASLGSRMEFSEDLQSGQAKSQEPNLLRSMPAHNTFQHSGDSHKLPRSQGISVLICPRAENGEDRLPVTEAVVRRHSWGKPTVFAGMTVLKCGTQQATLLPCGAGM
ncbi:hypothetical protein INR49_017128, partial [Caranx melampygus]